MKRSKQGPDAFLPRPCPSSSQTAGDVASWETGPLIDGYGHQDLVETRMSRFSDVFFRPETMCHIPRPEMMAHHILIQIEETIPVIEIIAFQTVSLPKSELGADELGLSSEHGCCEDKRRLLKVAQRSTCVIAQHTGSKNRRDAGPGLCDREPAVSFKVWFRRCASSSGSKRSAR